MLSQRSGLAESRAASLSLDELRPLITHLFAFSFAWALGGNLAHTLRDAFHAHTRELFADLLALPDGPLLDYYVAVEPGRAPVFRAWADAVPGFQPPAGSSQQQMLVPTVDTVRIAFLVEARLPMPHAPVLPQLRRCDK